MKEDKVSTATVAAVMDKLNLGRVFNSRSGRMMLVHLIRDTKGGSITVPLTSCLTGLDYSVLQIKTKIVSCHTAYSEPVKQEVNSTVILPPLVFPGHNKALSFWVSNKIMIYCMSNKIWIKICPIILDNLFFSIKYLSSY